MKHSAAGFLDVVPRWVQAIVAVLALLGIGAGGTVAVIKGTSGRSGTSSSSSAQTTPPAGPAAPVYLSDLQPQSGDTPMRGDTQIGDLDFPHSIFYDNVGGSNASACQNVPETCQATEYSIASGRYHRFSAMVGVTGCSGDTGQWSLSLGGMIVKSRPIAVNSSAQAVSVAIPAGNDLELLVQTSGSSGAACGPVNIIWWYAQLS